LTCQQKGRKGEGGDYWIPKLITGGGELVIEEKRGLYPEIKRRRERRRRKKGEKFVIQDDECSEKGRWTRFTGDMVASNTLLSPEV